MRMAYCISNNEMTVKLTNLLHSFCTVVFIYSTLSVLLNIGIHLNNLQLDKFD